jgi:hypothetical protein
MVMTAGCDRAGTVPGAAAEQGTAAHAEAKPDKSEEGVTLKPEEVTALGIVTGEARSVRRAPEVSGFAVVVAREPLAQGLAELRTAIAAHRQSLAALERNRRLAGTPGAMPADTQEAAQRQAAADEATLELARQRLLATFGQDAPWKNPESSPELGALTGGRSRLVRVTFPLGALASDPQVLRLARLDQAATGWMSHTVWRAPADGAVPGRSYFALLQGSEPGEGDHLLAWAATGEPEAGVLVPASAVIISGGRFYCYLEKAPGTFVRTEIDPNRPMDGGYFASKGITAGNRIVTSAAGQLLARELNPSKEAE